MGMMSMFLHLRRLNAVYWHPRVKNKPPTKPKTTCTIENLSEGNVGMRPDSA